MSNRTASKRLSSTVPPARAPCPDCYGRLPVRLSCPVCEGVGEVVEENGRIKPARSRVGLPL